MYSYCRIASTIGETQLTTYASRSTSQPCLGRLAQNSRTRRKATEERQWRKLVQRAINVRNRHPELDDQKCRLCHAEEESMLHLVQCRLTRPLWRTVLTFCRDVLGAPDMRRSVERAIIFNQANPKEMLPIAALGSRGREAAAKLHKTRCRQGAGTRGMHLECSAAGALPQAERRAPFQRRSSMTSM